MRTEIWMATIYSLNLWRSRHLHHRFVCNCRVFTHNSRTTVEPSSLFCRISIELRVKSSKQSNLTKSSTFFFFLDGEILQYSVVENSSAIRRFSRAWFLPSVLIGNKRVPSRSQFTTWEWRYRTRFRKSFSRWSFRWTISDSRVAIWKGARFEACPMSGSEPSKAIFPRSLIKETP